MLLRQLNGGLAVIGFCNNIETLVLQNFNDVEANQCLVFCHDDGASRSLLLRLVLSGQL